MADAPAFIKPTPDTTWPHPERVGVLEWQLRYGGSSVVLEADRLLIASALAAYLHLVEVPSAAGMLPKIRARLREERSGPPFAPNPKEATDDR